VAEGLGSSLQNCAGNRNAGSNPARRAKNGKEANVGLLRCSAKALRVTAAGVQFPSFPQ
jgi:hypothetical protein